MNHGSEVIPSAPNAGRRADPRRADDVEFSAAVRRSPRLKALVVGVLILPAALAARLSGGAWSCFCLAWARAHLGRQAVPLDSQLVGLIDFPGTRRVRIGHHCRLDKRLCLETRGEGQITIGDGAVISPGTLIVAHERVTIDAEVMIGEYCSIRDQDHRIDGSGNVRASGYLTAPIRICRDVWIGRGCTVLKGVTIGEGAVIGAGSLVARNVPAGEVWVGSPAKFLRHRETESAE